MLSRHLEELRAFAPPWRDGDLATTEMDSGGVDGVDGDLVTATEDEDDVHANWWEDGDVARSDWVKNEDVFDGLDPKVAANNEERRIELRYEHPET
ncbi:hypothetical protein HDV00_000836, partial [Rhizophlyctis rosea]